jgi:hypothetical protein
VVLTLPDAVASPVTIDAEPSESLAAVSVFDDTI